MRQKRLQTKENMASPLKAMSVFYDDFAIQFFDDGHSELADRFLVLGRSNQSRVLLICHCEQESGNLIRIISARKATKNERKLYKGAA